MDTFTDITVWALQWFLASWFVLTTLVALPLVLSGRVGAGAVPAFAALSRRGLVLIGLAHIAGGLGLVLPQLTGFLPWLTPVAALALAVQCFLAGGYHLRAGEDLLEPSLWGMLCLAVCAGRFDLLATAPELPEVTAAATIMALFIALVVNLVRLLRGSQNPFRGDAAAGTGAGTGLRQEREPPPS